MFPNFTYKELLNMDIRDKAFWLREARKKALVDEIRQIDCIRVAMADKNDYQRVRGELNNDLRKLIHGEQKIISQSWEELRLLAKRKRG